MNKSRIWYVEDIHDQTGLYVKAYKNKPKDVATVKVVEEIPLQKDDIVFYSMRKDKIYSGYMVLNLDEGDSSVQIHISDSNGPVKYTSEEFLDDMCFIGDI